jgi:hypothetical protein
MSKGRPTTVAKGNERGGGSVAIAVSPSASAADVVAWSTMADEFEIVLLFIPSSCIKKAL